MNITRTRRITCTADETIEYSVSDDLITHLMGKDGMTKEEAVEHVMENGLVSVDSYNVEVDEVVMEHESNLNF